MEWEKAVDEARKLSDDANVTAFYDRLLPTALTIIEKFEIEGLSDHPTYEEFPASPRLIGFLIDSITTLYLKTNGSDDEKKQPEPSLTT